MYNVIKALLGKRSCHFFKEYSGIVLQALRTFKALLLTDFSFVVCSVSLLTFFIHMNKDFNQNFKFDSTDFQFSCWVIWEISAFFPVSLSKEWLLESHPSTETVSDDLQWTANGWTEGAHASLRSCVRSLLLSPLLFLQDRTSRPYSAAVDSFLRPVMSFFCPPLFQFSKILKDKLHTMLRYGMFSANSSLGNTLLVKEFIFMSNFVIFGICHRDTG